MGKVIDISGQRFGRLTVSSWISGVRWLCVCDCGAECVVAKSNLHSGAQESCGCLRLERLRAAITTHGESRKTSPEYRAWLAMRTRCNNKTRKQFYDYGGRGIAMHQRWDSFVLFLEDIGRRPSVHHSLDRINNHKGYEPGNVRWATRVQQNNNKRNNRIVLVDGELVSLTSAARKYGLPPKTVFARIDNYKWDLMKALTTPLYAKA